MESFFQAAGAVILGIILTKTLSEWNKSWATILSMGVCVLVLLPGIRYMEPVLDFLRELETLGNLQGDMMKILLKASGVGIITEITALLCTDSGNTSLAQSLRILSSAVILWLSLPIFRGLLGLIQDILGGV